MFAGKAAEPIPVVITKHRLADDKNKNRQYDNAEEQ